MSLLVTPERLAFKLQDTRVHILDATYYALEPERDARADFESGHIPGALFLDLEHLIDVDDPVPGMAPSAGQFAARMAALGVKAGERILLYDQAPHRTACRAWWLFRLFGYERVALLDGGLTAWRADARPIETGAVVAPGGGDLPAARDTARVRDLRQLRVIAAGAGEQLIDARGAARFTGAEGDPRPGVAAGHIPGAKNLPYGRLFQPDGTWKQGEALAKEYEAIGIDLDRPIVTTCGSGITASVLLFGLALLGKEDWALYDGSWSEWGADPTTPKAVGL